MQSPRTLVHAWSQCQRERHHGSSSCKGKLLRLEKIVLFIFGLRSAVLSSVVSVNQSSRSYYCRPGSDASVLALIIVYITWRLNHVIYSLCLWFGDLFAIMLHYRLFIYRKLSPISNAWRPLWRRPPISKLKTPEDPFWPSQACLSCLLALPPAPWSSCVLSSSLLRTHRIPNERWGARKSSRELSGRRWSCNIGTWHPCVGGWGKEDPDMWSKG